MKNSLSHERGSERSERASEQVSAVEGACEASSPEASERVSGASERANGQESGPVLTSLFLFVPDLSGLCRESRRPGFIRTTGELIHLKSENFYF